MRADSFLQEEFQFQLERIRLTLRLDEPCREIRVIGEGADRIQKGLKKMSALPRPLSPRLGFSDVLINHSAEYPWVDQNGSRPAKVPRGRHAGGKRRRAGRPSVSRIGPSYC